MAREGKFLCQTSSQEAELSNFKQFQNCQESSGTYNHCLAVSSEDRIFGRESNFYGQIGLGKEASSISSFTEISSLSGNKIRTAYAGYTHSLFETHERKIQAMKTFIYQQRQRSKKSPRSTCQENMVAQFSSE